MLRFFVTKMQKRNKNVTAFFALKAIFKPNKLICMKMLRCYTFFSTLIIREKSIPIKF